MVEVHVGPLHVVDLQQPLQCTVRPRRHRSRHRGVRTLRLLRHLQGPSLDAKPGLSPLLPVAEEYAELKFRDHRNWDQANSWDTHCH